MSKETLEWLNSNLLVGFSEKRGKAWWYRSNLDVGAEPNHYTGAIPVGDVKRRLFAFQTVDRFISLEVPTDLDSMTALSDEGMPIRYKRIPERKAVATDDDHTVLGVFRPGYAIHQYSEWLIDKVEPILDDELSISSAGLLKNRAQAWVEVSVPDNIVTPEGVEFRPNLLAVTSSDGSLATTYKRTITNTVCDNSMALALSEGGAQMKFKHSRNSTSRIADARAALEIIYSAADEFSSQVAKLVDQKVSEEQWRSILDRLVPNADDGQSKRGVSMANTKREQLQQLWTSDPRVAEFHGTAWGVRQSFSTWEQHLKATKADTIRVERNQSESIDGTLERQEALVMAAIQGMDFGQSLALAPLS